MDPREPSGPIQTLAPGLLELLQLKNQGRNPTVMIDSLQPTIDLLQFYLQGQVEVATNNTLSAGGGAISILTFLGPVADQPTFVHDYSVYIPVGAATTDVAGVALTMIDTNNVHTILASQNFSTTIAGATHFVSLSVRNFWRSLGSGLGLIVACPAAGTALTPQLSLRFTRTQV